LKDVHRHGVAASRAAATVPKSSAQALWDYLLTHSSRK
jgi:hypothetical protein